MSTDQNGPNFKNKNSLLNNPHFNENLKNVSLAQQAKEKIEVPLFEVKSKVFLGPFIKYFCYLLAIASFIFFSLDTYRHLSSLKYQLIQPLANLLAAMLAGLLLIYGSVTYFLRLSNISRIKARLRLYKNRITYYSLDGEKFRIPIDEIFEIHFFPIFFLTKYSWVKIKDCYSEVFIFGVSNNNIFLNHLKTLTSRQVNKKLQLTVFFAILLLLQFAIWLTRKNQIIILFLILEIILVFLAPFLLMCFGFFSKRRIIARNTEYSIISFVLGIIFIIISMQPLNIKDRQFMKDWKDIGIRYNILYKQQKSPNLNENCSKLLINYPKIPKYYHGRLNKICPQFNFNK